MWAGVNAQVRQNPIGRVFLGRAIRAGQKKWQPTLGIEFPCNEWEVTTWNEGASLFFSGLGERWRFSFVKLCLVWRVHCSLSIKLFFFLFWGEGGVARGAWKQRVPKFLTCSPKKFPIAPHFYPICFGKYCPPFTYIGGPKWRISILWNKAYYCGEPP